VTAALRRAGMPLGVRNYRRSFAGQIISVSGNWMQNVAEMWLIVQLTGSGAAVGFTAGLQFVPVLVVFLGSTPIGAPLVGWLAEIAGPRVGMALGACAALAAAGLASVAYARVAERQVARTIVAA
jgi:hypothetical protein